jgi:hypothetical protein
MSIERPLSAKGANILHVPVSKSEVKDLSQIKESNSVNHNQSHISGGTGQPYMQVMRAGEVLDNIEIDISDEVSVDSEPGMS